MHRCEMACGLSDRILASVFSEHQLLEALAQDMVIIQERDSIDGRVLDAL